MDVETVKENDVRVEAPVAVKPFKGLIAFSLNKEEFAAAEKFFAGAPGKNLQLKIKAMVLSSVNDNKVDGGVVNGGQVEVEV